MSAIVASSTCDTLFDCLLRPDLSLVTIREVVMEVLVDRCAGWMCTRRQVMACVRRRAAGPSERESEVRTFCTFERRCASCATGWSPSGVTAVAMEATGVYWKPVWHVLEDAGVFEL